MTERRCNFGKTMQAMARYAGWRARDTCQTVRDFLGQRAFDTREFAPGHYVQCFEPGCLGVNISRGVVPFERIPPDLQRRRFRWFKDDIKAGFLPVVKVDSGDPEEGYFAFAWNLEDLTRRRFPLKRKKGDF